MATTEIDIYAGKRLRERRKLSNITQSKIAREFGVSFQQIQKYERGINRMSAGAIYKFSEILHIPPSYFFPKTNSKIVETPIAVSKLARDFMRLKPDMQKPIKELIETCIKLED